MSAEGRTTIYRLQEEDEEEMDKILTKQVTLTDLTPLFNEGEAMGCQIDGRTFYPGLPLHLKGAVQKPDGGLRGFIRVLEFVKKETEAQKEIEKIVAERGCEYLKSEEESEIRAADGIKVFLVHVLETVPKEPETDVDFPPTLPRLDPDKFVLLAESTAEKPWTFTSTFHPDMLLREYWRQSILYMCSEAFRIPTEVDVNRDTEVDVNGDTMTFELRMDGDFGYSLDRTVESITRPAQKRKRENDSPDTVKRFCK